jgi:Tol biopolymer transport system component
MNIKIYICTFLLVLLICGGCRPKNIQPGVQLLTPSFDDFNSIVWSPSSDQVLVSSYSSQNDSKVFIYDIETGIRKLILKDHGELLVRAWSPDGSNIALESYSTDLFYEGIWILKLEDLSSIFIDLGDAATWSPNGEELAIFYCDYEIDSYNGIAFLSIYDLDTNVKRTVYTENGCSPRADLSWSPDGKYIALSYSHHSSMTDMSNHIFLIEVSTGKTSLFTESTSWSPSWSPQGDMIAFIRGSYDLMNYELNIYDVANSCSFRIRDLKIPILGSVAWSPDGLKLAVGGGGDVYIVNISDGKNSPINMKNAPCLK